MLVPELAVVFLHFGNILQRASVRLRVERSVALSTAPARVGGNVTVAARDEGHGYDGG